MRHYLLVLLLAILSLPLHAQDTVTGLVVDSVSGQGLAGAGVMLKRGGKTVAYGRTDKQGRFVLNVARHAGDQLQAVLMGYAKQTVNTSGDGGIVIRMAPQAFQLREVRVQGSPVLQHKDTVTYDLTRFATERDNNLKDVLKKLPGVEVAKNGEISVNGKKLSRFTVEGMDLTKGKYNKLTENIRAKDVKKAEVINHDQPVKALRNRVFTDDVAMNITLKDSARDRMVPTLRPYLLVGDPTNVGGDATVMQIGRKKQMEYTAQYDRTGRDLEEQYMSFYSLYGRGTPATLPQWFAVAGLQAPIDAGRLRMNTSQAYAVDYVSKTKSGSENNLSAEYIRAVTRQHTTNSSLYYLGGDPALTTENKMLTLREDKFDLELNHTINADTHYGSITLKTTAEQSDALSLMDGTSGQTSQRVRNPEVNVKANVQQTYNRGRGQLEWNSLVDYHYSKDALYLDGNKQAYANNLWHTSHRLGYNRSSRSWNYSLDGTLEAEALNVAHANNVKLDVGLQPALRYNGELWRLTIASPLTLTRFTRQRQTMLLPSPMVYLSRDNGNRNSWSISMSYGESAGEWNYYALDNLRTDYRTWYRAAGFVPRDRQLSSYMTYKYQRAICHFFANASLSASRAWRNVVSDMQVTDGNYYFNYLQHDTHSDLLRASADVSKGFYKARLKMSLKAGGTLGGGEQYSAGETVPYNYRSFSLEPEVVYSPSFMEAEYKGTFGLNRSEVGHDAANSLFDWTQRLSLTSTLGNADLTLSGVLFHNDLEAAPAVNTFLIDAAMVWRIKRVRVKAELRNICDKKSYSATTYSGVGVFTNSYGLRPRELVVSVQFCPGTF